MCWFFAEAGIMLDVCLAALRAGFVRFDQCRIRVFPAAVTHPASSKSATPPNAIRSRAFITASVAVPR